MTEVFATGIQMGESPRWHDGRFWMCDWLAGEVLVFDADGGVEGVLRDVAHVVPVDPHRARGHVVEAGDEHAERRLPGP